MDAAELYARIRRRADIDDEYLDPEELGELAEEGFLELWDLRIAALGDEAEWERVAVNTTAGQEYVDVTLAQGCYRMLRLDFAAGSGPYRPIGRGTLASDELTQQAASWSDATAIRYYARRSVRANAAARATLADGFAAWRIHFSPTPSAVYSVRLWYIPPPLVTFTVADSVKTYTSFPDEWPEYVVQYCCAEIAKKQEADPGPFLAKLEHLRERIERYYTPTQTTQPRFVADHRRHQGELDDLRGDYWRNRGA